MIRDEDNICLKCRYGVIYKAKIQPRDCSWAYTMCSCYLHYLGKNSGYRKTCKYFVARDLVKYNDKS